MRKAPFKRATLGNEDVSVDFAAVTTPKGRVAIIATMTLTRDEEWTTGEAGTMWVFHHGRFSMRPSDSIHTRGRRSRQSELNWFSA